MARAPPNMLRYIRNSPFLQSSVGLLWTWFREAIPCRVSASMPQRPYRGMVHMTLCSNVQSLLHQATRPGCILRRALHRTSSVLVVSRLVRDKLPLRNYLCTVSQAPSKSSTALYRRSQTTMARSA